jgi:nucleotide-binding universal stress UspA family protein
MASHDRILVPTDGSDGVERATDHATEEAATHDATTHGRYVLSTDSYAGLAMESSWDSADRLLRENAKAAVARIHGLADEKDAAVRVETVTVEGKPSREIVRHSENEGCDLIVIGTHGRGGIDRLLLGSVAENVIRASSIPVTTVPVGGYAGRRCSQSPTWTTRSSPSVQTTSDPGNRTSTASPSTTPAGVSTRTARPSVAAYSRHAGRTASGSVRRVWNVSITR